MGFWDAVASAEPYANNLHLAPDRQPHKHLIIQFLQAGCSFWRPTNNVKHWRQTGTASHIPHNEWRDCQQKHVGSKLQHNKILSRFFSGLTEDDTGCPV